MITLSGFGKDYGDFTAVDAIDLKIEAGETFGFIGPNGAGKTTTIRMMLDIFKPDAGEISVFDGVMDEAKKQEKNLGQAFGFFKAQ